MIDTSISLMSRMRDPSNEDWERFYSIYRDGIIAFACSRGLSRDQANDVLQEAFLVLMRKLPDFQYDPAKGKFRGYLYQILRYLIARHFRRIKRRSEYHLDSVEAAKLPAPSDESEDASWENALMLVGLQQLKQKCAKRGSNAYDIFYKMTIERVPVSELANRYNTTENNIYQTKHRMLAKLRLIVESLATEDLQGIDQFEIEL